MAWQWVRRKPLSALACALTFVALSTSTWSLDLGHRYSDPSPSSLEDQLKSLAGDVCDYETKTRKLSDEEEKDLQFVKRVTRKGASAMELRQVKEILKKWEAAVIILTQPCLDKANMLGETWDDKIIGTSDDVSKRSSEDDVYGLTKDGREVDDSEPEGLPNPSQEKQGGNTLRGHSTSMLEERTSFAPSFFNIFHFSAQLILKDAYERPQLCPRESVVSNFPNGCSAPGIIGNALDNDFEHQCSWHDMCYAFAYNRGFCKDKSAHDCREICDQKWRVFMLEKCERKYVGMALKGCEMRANAAYTTVRSVASEHFCINLDGDWDMGRNTVWNLGNVAVHDREKPPFPIAAPDIKYGNEGHIVNAIAPRKPEESKPASGGNGTMFGPQCPQTCGCPCQNPCPCQTQCGCPLAQTAKTQNGDGNKGLWRTACKNDCSYHGDCVGTECVCWKGFEGEDCSIINSEGSGTGSEPCDKSNKFKRGAKDAIVASEEAAAKQSNCLFGRVVDNVCVCDEGFTGPDCGSRRCPRDCNSKGTCKEGICTCKKGWKGVDCTIPPDCPNRCSNNGICLEESGKCLCNCGWIGDDCSLLACPNNCTNHGTCKEGKCQCSNGWAGNDCSVRGCSSATDCSSRGECFQGKCICEAGFFGPKCEQTHPTCPNDCFRKGHCFNGTCHCFPGFKGVDCSEKACLNECSHHGLCKAGGVCECVLGWAGIDCSQKQCVGCTNGHCVDGKCVCFPNWAGSLCDQRLCPNNCSNHGSCSQTSGKCTCDPGFDGLDCSIKLCPRNCSGNGACSFNGTCTCAKGWVGVDCSQREPNCPKKCSGNGICQDDICFCKPGWSGRDCSLKTCKDECNHQGYCNDGRCVCFPDFAGETCAISTKVVPTPTPKPTPTPTPTPKPKKKHGALGADFPNGNYLNAPDDTVIPHGDEFSQPKDWQANQKWVEKAKLAANGLGNPVTSAKLLPTPKPEPVVSATPKATPTPKPVAAPSQTPGETVVDASGGKAAAPKRAPQGIPAANFLRDEGKLAEAENKVQEDKIKLDSDSPAKLESPTPSAAAPSSKLENPDSVKIPLASEVKNNLLSKKSLEELDKAANSDEEEAPPPLLAFPFHHGVH